MRREVGAGGSGGCGEEQANRPPNVIDFYRSPLSKHQAPRKPCYLKGTQRNLEWHWGAVIPLKGPPFDFSEFPGLLAKPTKSGLQKPVRLEWSVDQLRQRHGLGPCPVKPYLGGFNASVAVPLNRWFVGFAHVSLDWICRSLIY